MRHRQGVNAAAVLRRFKDEINLGASEAQYRFDRVGMVFHGDNSTFCARQCIRAFSIMRAIYYGGLALRFLKVGYFLNNAAESFDKHPGSYGFHFVFSKIDDDGVRRYFVFIGGNVFYNSLIGSILGGNSRGSEYVGKPEYPKKAFFHVDGGWFCCRELSLPKLRGSSVFYTPASSRFNSIGQKHKWLDLYKLFVLLHKFQTSR